MLSLLGGSAQGGIYVENLTLTTPGGALIGEPAFFEATATARFDGVEQEEKDAGSTVWWKFEWWFRAPQPPADPGTPDYTQGWTLSSYSGTSYCYENDTDMPSKLVLVRATAKIEESTANASASTTVNIYKLALAAVATGNTPDLDYGCMCINAQQQYKKAKWKATVLPTGNSATVTGYAGEPVVVPELTNVTDQQVIEVTAPASGTGEYSLKISLNAHPELYVDGTGGMTFRFWAESANATGETGDLTVATGGYNDYGPADVTVSDPDACSIDTRVIAQPSEAYSGKVKATAHAEFCSFGGWLPWSLGIYRNSIWNELVSSFQVSIGIQVEFLSFSVGYTVPQSGDGSTAGAKTCVFISAVNGQGSPSQGPQYGKSITTFPYLQYSAVDDGVTGLETSTEGQRTFDLSQTEWIALGGGKGAGAGATRNCYHNKADASLDSASVWNGSYWKDFEIIE